MRSSESSGIGKRDVELHAVADMSNNRRRRQANIAPVDTENGFGTNMKMVTLSNPKNVKSNEPGTYEIGSSSINVLMIGVIIGIIVIILIVALIIGAVIRRRQQKEQPPFIVNGVAKVVANGHFDDNTEV